MTADAVGGVWTCALELSRVLGRRGVCVTMAVMGPPPNDAQRRAAEAIPGLELLHRPYRLEWMHGAWADVEAAGAWLLDLGRTRRPDVVHLNGYVHAALPWTAPVVVVGHSCVLSWWRAVHGADAPPSWDRYADAVARGLAAADLVVAPTAAMLEALAFHYGAPARTRVIPNGRALPGAPRRKARAILTAGRLWDAAKNAESVCAVAPSLPWPVYVAGDCCSPDGRAVRLQDAVRPLGVLSPDDLADCLARAAIFALPARYEPFGLTALEAGLAGCALVLGDIRSLREVWGDAATFVLCDNRRALAVALTALIGDDERRGEMQRRAQARARELTPERMADRYDEAYQACDGHRLHAFTAV